MKVIVTDFSFPNLEIEQEILRPTGAEFMTGQCKTRELLLPFVADADVVITQFAPITAEVIGAMTKARAIIRYGIGVDNIDLEAARAKGIAVANVPDYCIDEVADHTLAFILGLTRQVVSNCATLKSGKWGLATPIDQMCALRDRTVGVVGFGRIGREVVARLRAFKCRVIVFDPVVQATEIEASGATAGDLDTVLEQTDIVTLHCPSNAQTRGMIGRESLGRMRKGAFLINVARGDLVDPVALMEALDSGQLGGAALDVFNPEPIPTGHAVLSRSNIIVASHIASVSVPAVRKLRETVAWQAAMALRGERMPNIVNGV
jgi:D-3-phosphoglycerate dehydrogenase / 2-oxoglutarate reductase